jgi:toxin ParE1/3/4
MTPWRFEPEALDDLQAASARYDSERNGLGLEFVLAVETAIAAVCVDPAANPIARGPLRRRRVLRFPYDVIFGINATSVVIVAVAHHHRRPGYWQKRI